MGYYHYEMPHLLDCGWRNGPPNIILNIYYSGKMSGIVLQFESLHEANNLMGCGSDSGQSVNYLSLN